MTIDPDNGNVVQRKYIGLGYQPPSRTLDIVNHNDSIYVFKQQGLHLVLEQYDEFGSLLWRQNFADTGFVIGGQMQVVDDYVYFTATRGIIDSVLPYTLLETEQIIFARLTATLET